MTMQACIAKFILVNINILRTATFNKLINIFLMAWLTLRPFPTLLVFCLAWITCIKANEDYLVRFIYYDLFPFARIFVINFLSIKILIVIFVCALLGQCT